MSNLLVSDPRDSGHMLILRLPDSLRVLADPALGETMDLTLWAPELVLAGLVARTQGVADDQQALGVETVEIATLRLARALPDGRFETIGSEMVESSYAGLYVHAPSHEVVEFEIDEALVLMRLGVAATLTRLVAEDVMRGQVPEGLEVEESADAEPDTEPDPGSGPAGASS